MSQILEQEKARLILELNQHLEKIQNPFITQDIETGVVDFDIDILEEWKIAYAIEKEIYSINGFLLNDLLVNRLNDIIQLKLNTAKGVVLAIMGFGPLVGVRDEIIIKMQVLLALLVTASIAGGFLISIMQLVVRNLPSKTQALMYNFLACNFDGKKVASAFEARLINNYQLQKPTGLYPAMLTPTIMNYFARNKHLAIGFPGDFSNEKRQLQNQIFWEKLNPWSTAHTSHEVSRLFAAYEHFHSGKPVSTFNHLIDTFTDPYLQSIADNIMGQVLLILSSRLINCTTEEKRHFYQLMGHYAKHQPYSSAFLYASHGLQHPDSEDIPIEWGDNVLSIQKSIKLCNLDQKEHKAIVKMLAGIFNPAGNCSLVVPSVARNLPALTSIVISEDPSSQAPRDDERAVTPAEPFSKKIPDIKYCCFFPEVKIRPEIAFDETYSRLNGMKVLAKMD